MKADEIKMLVDELDKLGIESSLDGIAVAIDGLDDGFSVSQAIKSHEMCLSESTSRIVDAINNLAQAVRDAGK